jgi:diaminohydroxyphosphoribosylaminopyrimidine deaminase/5-amino-6-(5-phosphoribosylamino)uracil reductase
MLHALELAERGRGSVEPNPLVGALLVRDGAIVGEGWHQRYGQAHAEVNAIESAGERARGATLYVTLEPCCHHGKTPPCTSAVIAAGIARVVVAMLDPFPLVAGQGVKLLLAGGIAVEVGLAEAQARRLNAPYLKLLASGRPYVHAKWAMTLDGKICTRTGDAKWISGEASRRRVHQLRGRMDAIVVGIGTALADDPLLTARPPGPRIATRVVLDSDARLPLKSQLVRSARQMAVMVVTNEQNSNCDALRGEGCEVLVVPKDDARPGIGGLLDELGKRRMTNILVEGGSEVLGSFFDAGQVDEVWAFIAPRVLGGAGKSPVAARGKDRLADAMALMDCHWEEIEGDFLVRGITALPPLG